jgi:hypothetical protein
MPGVAAAVKAVGEVALRREQGWGRSALPRRHCPTCPAPEGGTREADHQHEDGPASPGQARG